MQKRIFRIISLIVILSLLPVFAIFGLDQARIVYIAGSGNGTKYHVENCRTLRNGTSIKITLEDAKEQGYTPCGICKPGE